ncbi:MAG: hypothetical protein ACI9NN_002089, partial [Bacteroidia bacterium]
LNSRWAKQENVDDWSQLIIKHTKETLEMVHEAPLSGIWVMDNQGQIHFDRMDTHRRAVETENEAFFLRISNTGDYLYEGADMGIVVLRGRMMTDDFQITDRAKTWINAIRSKYQSNRVDANSKSIALTGSLSK